MRANSQDSLTDYHQCLEFLYSLQKFGIKFGLNRTENLLARLGNPEKRLRCIHIAGTNGKGSTAATLSTVLQRHGYRVGLYTSPHLVRFTERFVVNGREVEPQRIVEIFRKVRDVIDSSQLPTFFEVVTAMAFTYFAEERLDWAVIEVGMGGRLDATNVCQPLVSVITNVSLEHQEYLGTTLSAIAREKAGIIKYRVPVITSARQPVVQSILKTTCLRNDSQLYRLGTHFRVRRNADGSFQYHGLELHIPNLRTNLSGDHQHGNTALAICTVELLARQNQVVLNPEAVAAGISEVQWPARLEVLEQNPTVILDGAHNPQGAEALRSALKSSFSYRNLHLVLGIMDDKDIRGIFRKLLPLAETVILTKPAYSRSAQPEGLRRLARPYHCRVYVIHDPASAIEQAKNLAQPEDLVCIAGSLYFAGEVKQLYGEPEII